MTIAFLIQILVSGLAVGAIYGIVALGYNAIFATARVVNFAQGELVTLGALVGFSAYVMFDLPIVAAFAVSIGWSASWPSSLNGRRCDPIRDSAQSFLWIMSTFGFGIALRQVAMLIWGRAALPFPKFIGGDDPLRIGSVLILPQEIGIVLLGLGATIGFEAYKRRTTFGTAVRAVSADPEAASLMGIEVRRVVLFSYAISGAMAAIGGMLVAPITFADPTQGLIFGVKGFIALVIGGLGNAVGGMLGGLLLGVVEALSATYASPAWKDIIVFMMLIGVLLIRPQGLLAPARSA